MDHHGLRQADLLGEFGSQSNVREVLNGKREINARLCVREAIWRIVGSVYLIA
jgi:antitoxin component HigA of HigAB toxin-antitoxin module